MPIGGVFGLAHDASGFAKDDVASLTTARKPGDDCTRESAGLLAPFACQ